VGEVAKLHADLEALVGTLIHDRYRVDTLLGVGGMGAVFRGYHTGLRRDVAIKLLHPEIGRDESISKRFDREAMSASRLDHPNCVRVSDFGTTQTGAKYLVMEFLEGGELDIEPGKPWAVADAVAVAKQMFAGLEHAHHFGVVHRDLKPENVFVTHDYRGQRVVKLVDFGIAKLIDGEGAQDKLTRAGLVFGTPRYMSPEQAAGGKIDARTDLYAAGLILYEMLAGQPPFDADEPGQLLRMHIMAPPPPLPAGLPDKLVALVGKLLEKSKSDRCESAREVLDALEVIERELAAAPVVAAPVVAAPVVAAPVVAAPVVLAPASASAEARKTSWQPAPTTSLAPAPPPAAAVQPSVAVPLAVVPTLPPLPGPPPPAAVSNSTMSFTPAGTTPVGTTPVGTTPVGTTPIGTTPIGTTPIGVTAPMPVASPGPAVTQPLAPGLPPQPHASGTMPMIAASPIATGSHPVLPPATGGPTGSYPGTTNASTTASTTWSSSSASFSTTSSAPHPTVSQPGPERRSGWIGWIGIAAGVALVLALAAVLALTWSDDETEASGEVPTDASGPAPAELPAAGPSGDAGAPAEPEGTAPPPTSPPARKSTPSKPTPSEPDRDGSVFDIDGDVEDIIDRIVEPPDTKDDEKDESKGGKKGDDKKGEGKGEGKGKHK
jgi:hypothetical protein